MFRVAIVGGGPGGLMTAHLSARKYGSECSTTIFEASGRLGGKLDTRTFSTAAVPYESGAAEIYDYSIVGDDPFRRFVDELGLVTRPMGGHTVVLDDTTLRDDADIARYWGLETVCAIRDFRQRAARLLPLDRWHPGDWQFDATHPWADRTCAQLLDTIPDTTARKYFAVAAHSDLATEPHLTDGLTGLKNFVMDNPGYVSCHAIEGGMSRLAERLSERIPEAEVRLATRVVRLEQMAPESWRIWSTQDGAVRTDEFHAVILALPATQLASIDYGGQPLRQALTEHMQRFDRAGHYLRVTTLFRSPFWRDSLSGSWFMIDAFGGACVYDESARYDTGSYGVLGFLLAGNDALVLANGDDAAIVRRVIAALPPQLRVRAAEQLLEARVHRWCGAVSAQPGGNPAREPRSTHRPDADRLPGLLIVGDYLFDSTLNGVFQSADLATTLLSDCLPAVAASPTAQWCCVT